jgi:hypothetical protein
VDVLAARAKLQYLWSPRVDLLLSGDVTHQDATPLTYAKVLAEKPGFVVDNPQDFREVRSSIVQESRNLQYGTPPGSPSSSRRRCAHQPDGVPQDRLRPPPGRCRQHGARAPRGAEP